MARYRFQLEGVLRQRKHAEEEQQRVVASLLSQRGQCEEKLAALTERAEKTNAVTRTRLVGAIDVAYLANHQRFVDSSRQQMLRIGQRLKEIAIELESAQTLLIEAVKQRKVIEKLKERQQARRAEALSRKEARELDDVTTNLSHQNLRNSSAS